MSVSPPASQISANTLSSSWPEAPPKTGREPASAPSQPLPAKGHIALNAVLCGVDPARPISAPRGNDPEIGMGLGTLAAGLDGGDMGRQQDLSRLPIVAAGSSCAARSDGPCPLLLSAGPIPSCVAKRPMGSAPPAKTLAASFFPRRTKSPAPRGRFASKKAVGSGAPHALRPEDGFEGVSLPIAVSPSRGDRLLAEQQKRTRP